MGSKFVTITDFAKMILTMLKSDRDVNVGVGGMTGEGKSCFATALQKEYARISGTYWGYDRLTWSRKELMRWIDGELNKPVGADGLRPGQVKEYSAICPDELFDMFYRRNWFDEDQIDSIGTFNKCRDRHLFLCGNVPTFWELDGAFTNRIRFYVYIPYRGTAWIFEQELNPFSTDPWNKTENKKLFRKHKNPYSIPNFICEINYPDWTDAEKEAYYKIRNSKRLTAKDENRTDKEERYSNIKRQRDILIRTVFKLDKNLTNKDVGDLIDMSQDLIRLVRIGDR